MNKRIKRIISLMVCVSLMMVALPVEFTEYIGASIRILAATNAGDSFTVDGLNYTILSDNTSVTVTGATDTTITELKIPELVRYDDYDFQVTEIFYRAFNNCSRLTQIIMGNNVEKIGNYAFEGCKNLTDVQLSNSLSDAGYKAFSECTRLEEITLPASLTGNASEMFSGCNSLKKVNFAEGATTIPNGLFKNMSITTFECPDSITRIGNEAFQNCSNLESVVLSKKLEKIGESAFENCTKITEVELPETLKIMENDYYGGSFSGCKNLKKVNIPKTLEQGYLAFKNCSSLTQIDWKDGITKIPEGLFKECSGLKNITIPDSVTEIEKGAFYQCSSLAEVYLPNGLEKIGESAFENCTKLTEVELPETLKVMENKYYGGSFSGCKNMKKVNIPKTLEQGYLAFKNCSSLTQIDWKDGITKIPEGLFKECSGLKNITIPDSVTEIEKGAFYQCSSLAEVYLPNGLKKIGDSVFDKCPYLVMKMNRDSYATRYAITNKIPFEWIGNEVEGAANEFLNRTSSEYETSTQGANANGYINFKVKYGFKNSVKQSISNVRIQVYIPDGVKVIEDTIKVNDVLSTDFEQNGNFLEIPSQSNSGIVTFSVQANNYDDFYSYAAVRYTKSNVEFYEMISALNAELEPLSLHMDSQTDSNVFQISGIAMPDNDIDVYVDGKKYTTLQGTKAGTYAAAVTIDNMKKYKTYEIKVSSLNVDGVLVEQKQKITYIPKIPKLTDFSMEHNGQKYSLLEQKDLKPIVVFNPNKQLEFGMKFTNSEEIDAVYIVSNRSNVKKKIQAQWDEDSQKFVAKGYFDNSNHSYVPGTIVVEYITKGETHYINEKIDFTSEEYVNSITPEFSDADIMITKDTENEWEADFALPNMNDAEMVLNYTKEKLGDDVTETSLINDGYIKVPSEYILKDQNQMNAMEDISDDVMLFAKCMFSEGTKEIKTKIVDLRDKVVDQITLGVVSEGTIGAFSEAMDWADAVETWQGYRIDLNDAQKSIQNSSMNYAQKQQQLNRIETVRKMNNGKMCLKMLGAALSIAGYTVNPAIGMAMTAMTLMYDRELSGSMLDIQSLSAKESGSAEISFRWAVDPSGYVYDAETKEPLSGVTVTLFYKADENSTEEKWDASEYLQQNPLISAEDGAYAWDVPEGLWQVRCEKEGYEAACSEWLQVPPPQLGINIPMKKENADMKPEETPVPTIKPTATPNVTETPNQKMIETPSEQGIQQPKKSSGNTGNNAGKINTPKLKIKLQKKKTLKATWKKLTNISGYQIQYAPNKKFKKAKSKTVKSTSVTIKKLKKKKTYFVRVKAYKLVDGKKVYGKWSVVKKVKIKK